MKNLFLLLTAAAAVTVANAQINITGGGFTYTQDFNTLDTTGTSNTNLPTGWALGETGANANGTYRAGHGSSNTGDTYSFGTSGSTDRALGSVSSANLISAFGARFDNTSTDTIAKLVISHRLEQWRVGDTISRKDTTWFYYSTTADSVQDTVAAHWTEVPGLMLNSVVTVSTSTSGDSLDGNASGNFATVSDSFAVAVSPGQHVIIKWKDKNMVGSDDGLAIDDLSVTFRAGTVTGVKNVVNTSLPLSVLGNATANNITVGFTVGEAGKYQVEVLDLTGRTLHKENINAIVGIQRYTMSGMNLANGMYIVKLSNATTAGVTKVSVQ
jgi:hypothetical protein